jgi:phosphomevalonate kinase
MRVVAPGKLLLTGAYAVLDGAPALVAAVDRYACADGSHRAEHPSAEVRAAIGDEAPRAEAHALYDGDAKLGLGSSAAILVASLGVLAVRRGESLAATSVRDAIFAQARAAHAKVQGGGSGVDVAASVYGGVLRYVLPAGGPVGDAFAGPAVSIASAALPEGLVIEAFWSGASARTSDLRARVDALRERNPDEHAARLRDLGDAAERAVRATELRDLGAFLEAGRATALALHALGQAADAPIVPQPFSELGRVATAEGGVFFPSGAGGGDVAVYLGRAAPSETFLSRAYLFGMRPLSIAIDRRGVRLDDVHDSGPPPSGRKQL